MVCNDDSSLIQVNIYYTTTAGTASDTQDESQDFQGTSGRLTFANSRDRQNIMVYLVDDNVAEGPENFYVNITRVELVFPVWVSGLVFCSCV